MKKWIKKIIWIIVIAIVVIGGYFGVKNKNQTKEEYVTEKVQKGVLMQTVEATGSVESAKELELNFKIGGRVQTMSVAEGDTVRAGEVLARLEAGNLVSRVTDAQAVLEAARADLNRILSGASVEDIDVSQKTVEQREQAIVSAQNSLESLKSKAGIEIDNLRETALVELGSEYITGDLAMQNGKNVFNDNDAEGTLGVLDKSSVLVANDDLITAQETMATTKNVVAKISNDSSDEELRAALDSLKGSLDLVAGFLSSVYNALENTITSTALSETELDTLKSTIQTEYAKVSTSKSSLQAAKSNWLNKKIYYDDLIVQAEDAVKQTQEDLKVAKAQLGLKTAAPRDFEVAAQEAKMKQAQAALQLAQANLADAIIVAPTDGVVTKVENKVGEQTSLAAPVIKMVGTSNYEIKVDVPESDIAKVSIDQVCEITLDAFGEGKVFSGKVIFIEPAETIISDVVYYKVRVQFNDYDQSIKPGMTANLTIETAHKEGVLVLPLRAVKGSNGRRYVEVLVNGVPVEKDISLGLRGDNGYELLGGLNEGDEVVVYVKNSGK